MTGETTTTPSEVELAIWTIYERMAANYGYQARKFLITKDGAVDTGETMTSPTIGPLRYQFARMGKVRLMRADQDAQDIIESWI